MISRVRGTEDLLDLRLKNLIIKKAIAIFENHNFLQIETPILEPTALFVRSLGKETDVVSKEMYTFETGDTSICLRPEATAATMRAFLENGIQTIPWKVFSHGPMFRHERPQKGRWRQFSQINAEVIGSDVISQDASLIKILDSFFSESLKLENYILKINYLGTSDDRKTHKSKLHTFLDSVDICDTCKVRKEKNILRIFDCKNKSCKKAYINAPKITDFLSKESNNEWAELKSLLDILSISYIVDPLLVRGLDYYNKTVFEFSSNNLGSQDAICGGGRYNTLATQIGSKKDFPSIGAAIGIDRLCMLLENISLPEKKTLIMIIPLGKPQVPLALLLASELQSKNQCCDIILDCSSMKSMMRKANKSGAKYALIIGETEVENGTVSVKNMQTSEDFSIKQTELNKLK